MKNFFTNKRSPSGWLLSVWCTALLLISQLAIAQRSVTYTTEPLSAAGVPVGTSKHLIYKIKVVVGNQGGVTVGPVDIKTTGTYTSADISGFTLWYNTTNANLADAQLFQSAASVNGAGELLQFRGRSIGLASPSTVYFFLTADVPLTATGGRTVGINGATDPLNIGYYYNLPVVDNQQTNAAGLQTIVVPKVTYSTEIVPAGKATRDEIAHLLHTFKVEVGPLDIEITDVNIKTTGNYTAADISSFSLKRGNSYYGPSSLTVTGNGETLSWRLPRSVLPANSVHYFEVRANITSTATEGRTFGIDGSAKTLQISYRNRTPIVTDNQTNVSGLQVIVIPKVTYTTQAVPAASVLRGTSDKLLYILKVAVGPESPVKLKSIALPTKGNYTTSEISEFKI